MKVFAINGISLAGKDSFVYRIKGNGLYKATMYSTIDPVKDLYAGMGWRGEKTDADRKALNSMKAIWRKLNNGPMRYVQDAILKDAMYDKNMCFVMVREFDEMCEIVEWARETFGFGHSIELVRDGLQIPSVEQEFLDSHDPDYVYNWRVYNKTVENKTLPHLWDSAYEFSQRIADGNHSEHNVLGTKFDVSYLEKPQPVFADK